RPAGYTSSWVSSDAANGTRCEWSAAQAPSAARASAPPTARRVDWQMFTASSPMSKGAKFRSPGRSGRTTGTDPSPLPAAGDAGSLQRALRAGAAAERALGERDAHALDVLARRAPDVDPKEPAQVARRHVRHRRHPVERPVAGRLRAD